MEAPKNWQGCGNCKHLKVSEQSGYVCAAFPGGIPIYFASGDIAHVKVVPGQKGETLWEEAA